MKKITLHVLHGFLGLPSDWDFLKTFSSFEKTIISYSLYDEITSLEAWAQAFNKKISTDETNVLIGYSLGGRLALHALIDNPALWEKVVIISTHPGLAAESEKKTRRSLDQKWALSFLQDSWNPLIKDWNLQEVFCGYANSFARKECDFSRQALAKVLLNYSLATQQNLEKKISRLPQPILWIAGEKDMRYKSLALAQRFQNPQSEAWIASDAGHRVPWEQTEQFLHKLYLFLGA